MPSIVILIYKQGISWALSIEQEQLDLPARGIPDLSDSGFK
jgi:hypothetical protein